MLDGKDFFIGEFECGPSFHVSIRPEDEDMFSVRRMYCLKDKTRLSGDPLYKRIRVTSLCQRAFIVF